MEICEAPDPVEVTNFHFYQLRTLRLEKGDEKVSKECLNVVASASKYGLLFIGIEQGFKVLKLENILDLSDDKDNKTIEENYPCQVVISETPILLSLSADQKTLAVCLNRNGSLILDAYDIAAFADLQSTPAPFQNILLSDNGTKLKDFVWNPVALETYAYCTSDGSLSVHELNGNTLKVVASVTNASASCVCWSPKGKQIVVGKTDGSFSQYKPTLQEVKNIPHPPLEEKVTVQSISWVSTTQFVVLYVPSAESCTPYLFVVSTPKGSPIVFMNFYDACLGNSSNDDQRYFLHFEPTWGILVCASTDSIEIATLGDCPNFVQWDVKEDRKALLPVKDGASHAIGLGVMYSAQRKIVINEELMYPPMPIIFFLTNNGLLVSYHMINSTPGLESLVYPPEPFDKANERKRPGGLQNINTRETLPSSTTVSNSISFQKPPIFQPQHIQDIKSTAFASAPTFGLNQGFNQTKNEQVSIGIKPISTSNVPALVSSAIQASVPVAKASVSNQRGFQAPLNNAAFGGVHSSTTVDTPNLKMQGTPNSPALASKRDIDKENTYIAAVVEEVQTFEKELQDLKHSLCSFAPIGSREEMTTLKSATLSAEEFHKEMLETMTSLNTDIHDLKNVLLESFAMVEDANSRDRRKNDHLYIALLRERALDPITAKRLKQIEQHYMYLSTQLQEVRNKIDQDRFEYLEKKKTNRKSISHLSTVEAIYKTLVNNQNIIHNLKKSIDYIFEKAKEKKLENIHRSKNRSPFIKKTTQEELSKLADTFLETKISSEDDKVPKFKKIPAEAQEILKNYFSTAKVTTVRPTVISSPSQSRFISKSVLFSENMKKNELQANKVNEKKLSQAVPLISNEKLNLLNSSLTTDQLQKPRREEISLNYTVPSNQSPLPPEHYSPSGSSSGGPAYEDITPPGTPDYSSLNNLTLIQELMSQGNYDAEKIQMLLNAAIKYKNENLNEEITSSSNLNMNEFVDTENDSFKEQYSGSNSSSQSNISLQTPAFVSPLNISSRTNQLNSLKSNENKSSSSFSFSPSMGVKTTDNISTPKQFGVVSQQPIISNSPTTSSSGIWSNNQLKKNIPLNVSLNQPMGTSSPFTPAPNKTVSFAPNSNVLNLAENKSQFKDGNSLISPPPSNVSVPGISFNIKSNLTPVKSQSGHVFGGNLQNTFTTQQSSTISSSVSSSSIFSVPFESKTSASSLPFDLKSLDISSSFTFGKPSFTSKISTPPTLTFSQVTTSDSVAPSMASDNQAKSLFAAAGDTLFGQVLASESSAKKDSPSFRFVPTSTVTVSSAKKDLPLSKFAPTSILSESSAKEDSPSFTLIPNSTSEPESEVIELSLSDLSKSANTDNSHTKTVQVIGATTGDVAVTSSSGTQSAFASSVTNENTSNITSTTTSQSNENEANTDTNVSTTVSNVPQSPLVSATVTSSATSPLASGASLFGQSGGTSLFTSSTTTQSFFGGVNSSQPSLFSKPAVETTPTKSSLFGDVSSVTSTTPSFFGKTPEAPVFGQSTFSSGPVFGSTTTTTQGSVFGSTTTTTQGSVFGSAATTTQGSMFGTTTTTGSFFSQSPGGANPVFGTNTSESTGFGTQSGGSFFGKSPFGQTQGTFGLAKSVFGQTSTFGQPAAPQSNSGFGQPTGFGQGSFSFSGLGGKPSEENASKNVFAMGNLGKPPSENSNVFASSGASAFGSKTNTFAAGGFSSGGGSVAQSGFGAFQQNSQKQGGFGSSPAFGGTPSFGSPPAFGSAPSFGSGNALASVFGSSQQQSPTFSNFASANSPTFGGLASQTPAFGSPQQQQQGFGSPQQQQQGFGSAPVFGSGSAFGGQAPNFGSPSGGQSNSSAFTQWRN